MPTLKPTDKPTGRNPLLVAFVTIFLDLLGFGIIIPIQPFFAESFGATATVITLLSATYSLMQFIFAPFWGRLSDRVGRRPIILMSVAIGTVGHFIFASASSLAPLFIARAIAGFGTANLGTAQAIIADSTAPEDRAKGMGIIGAAFGLGFIFGPALGALLSQIDPTTPLYAAGLLGIGNFILAWFLLPETLQKSEGPAPVKPPFWAQFSEARQRPNVSVILLITLVSTTAFAQMEQSIALFIEHTWVVDPQLSVAARIAEAATLTGVFLCLVGLTAAIIQGGLIGTLTARFGEVRLIQVGLVILVGSLAAIPMAGDTGQFIYLACLAPVMASGTGILMPSRSSLLSRSVPSSSQGAVMGMNQSAAALGRVIGPAAAGVIYEMGKGLPFYAGAILMVVGVLLSWRLLPTTETEAISPPD